MGQAKKATAVRLRLSFSPGVSDFMRDFRAVADKQKGAAYEARA